MSISTKYSRSFFAVLILLLSISLAACFDGDSSSKSSGGNEEDPAATPSSAVTSTAPADGSKSVDTNIKIVAVFHSAMNPGTITQNSFTLQGEGEAAIVAAVAYNADTRSAILTPNGGLTPETVYTATLTTEVEDESGTALADNVEWTFTTGSTADTVAPIVSSNTPEDLETDVLRNTKVGVYFSEAIDPGSLSGDSFQLQVSGSSTVVPGSLRYINPTAVVFSPTDTLEPGTGYTLTLASTLTDLAGNSLLPVVIGFTTGSEVSSSPAPVELGTAGNYVILAKTGVSTTGTTSVTGDIAVSPESRTALTGFSETLDASGTFATSSLVTGELFAANMTSPTPGLLTTAVSDMELAYTNAAGRPDPDFTELGAGEIGGLTLDAGLYKWGTGVLVTSDVTLNGSPTDVWIFQIGQDLKLEDGRAIVLTGGALARNVFWQVAGEVTLQAGTTFNGIILSQTGVVVRSGAVINGRALAQTAVTLISNKVTEPAQ